jgi:MraZ protein
VFFGTFTHAIDAKGRTSLPARFREALAAAGEPKIVLTQYPHWRAVQALPLSEWKKLEEKLMQASPLDVRAQRNILRFYSTAHEVDLDVHGRVLVPPSLREYASLSKEVVWVGMGRHMHLFDRAAYEAQMTSELPEGEVVDFFKA